MRKIYTMGAVLVAGALVLTGCASTAPEAEEETGPIELVIGNNGDAITWDPAEMKEGAIIQYAEAIYDPLLRKTADAQIEGNLATDFEYNEDLTQLTLTLQEGITFSDDEPFNADAVKANIEARKLGAGSASEAAKSIEEVVIVDDTTVELDLVAPNPGLLSALATYLGFMASPAAIEAGTLGTDPIGSGPYVLNKADSEPAVSYSFDARDGYWNADAFPYDTLVIKPYTDFTARYNALATGQIQFMYGTADMVETAEADGLTVQTVPGEWQGVIMQDRAGSVLPALGDVRVRQAINYALDRETILDTYYNGLGQVSTQTFNPASDAWIDELNEEYPYDPEKAKDLLAEAGVENLSIEFDVPTRPYATAVSEVVVSQLAEVGITATINSTEFPAVWLDKVFTKHEYQMSVILAVEARDLLPTFNVPTYYIGYDNSVIAPLAIAADQASEEEWIAGMKEITEQIVADVPAVPLFLFPNIVVADAELTGIAGNSVTESLVLSGLAWK